MPASCRCWPALGWWLAQALWWGPTHCRWGASPPPYGSASCRLCARRQGYTSGLCRPGLLCPAERKRPCIAFGPGLAAVLLPTIPWSSAVLQEARDKFPALARWATWCYRQASNLQFGDTVLQSSSGVQQGDPLGPLLFAAAIQPLAAMGCFPGLVLPSALARWATCVHCSCCKRSIPHFEEFNLATCNAWRNGAWIVEGMATSLTCMATSLSQKQSNSSTSQQAHAWVGKAEWLILANTCCNTKICIHTCIYIYTYIHIYALPKRIETYLCLFGCGVCFQVVPLPPPPLSTCFLHALWLCLLCQLLWQTTVAYPFCQGTKPLSIVACPFLSRNKTIIHCDMSLLSRNKTTLKTKLPASVVHCGHHTLLSRMFFTLLCHHNLLPR